MPKTDDPTEKKDADTRNAFRRSYTLLVHVQESWNDQRLAQAVALLKEVHDEIVPAPRVNNPHGLRGKQ